MIYMNRWDLLHCGSNMWKSEPKIKLFLKLDILDWRLQGKLWYGHVLRNYCFNELSQTLHNIVCLQLLDKNWQTWNYQLRTYPMNRAPSSIWFPYKVFSMDEDYFFWVHYKTKGSSCTVIDRKTMAVKCVSMTASNDIIPINNQE